MSADMFLALMTLAQPILFIVLMIRVAHKLKGRN